MQLTPQCSWNTDSEMCPRMHWRILNSYGSRSGRKPPLADKRFRSIILKLIMISTWFQVPRVGFEGQGNGLSYFGGDPDHRLDPGIFLRILHHCEIGPISTLLLTNHQIIHRMLGKKIQQNTITRSITHQMFVRILALFRIWWSRMLKVIGLVEKMLL